jgi:hypothetical protein
MAAELQQRTEDATKLWMNPTEASEPGSAKDVGQDRFGLIIGGMGDCDFVELAFGHETVEEGVTGKPGGTLQIGVFALRLGGDVLAADEKGKRVACREVSYEFLVSIRGAATEFMIEVRDREDGAQFFLQLEKQKKQSNGIGATGNGHADPLSRRSPTVFLKLMEEAHGEVRIATACGLNDAGRFVRVSFFAHSGYRSNDSQAGRAVRNLDKLEFTGEME